MKKILKNLINNYFQLNHNLININKKFKQNNNSYNIYKNKIN